MNSCLEFIPHFYVKSSAEKVQYNIYFLRYLKYVKHTLQMKLCDEDSFFIGALKDGLRNGLECLFLV